MSGSNKMPSLAQATHSFSAVAEAVNQDGKAVILKDGDPKYLVVDVDNDDYKLDLTEDERIVIVAKQVLEKYLPAFKELAKW